MIENILLNLDLKAFGPNTITDKTALKESLQAIQKSGYVISVEELHEGVASMAVPVRDYTCEVVASISIVGPKQRIREAQYPLFIRYLQKAAERLSELLGGTPCLKK